MKKYYKNEESSYLKYWEVNNLYAWKMSKKLPVSGFEWIENISELDDIFIRNYNERQDIFSK